VEGLKHKNAKLLADSYSTMDCGFITEFIWGLTGRGGGEASQNILRTKRKGQSLKALPGQQQHIG
jgi:hypothetical protein